MTPSVSLVPLIRKDLMLVARQRRWFAARAVLVGLLLLITTPLFIILYVSVRTSGAGGTADSARGLFLTFAWVQVGILGLACPALGAGSLADTRADASLDLLRLASISRPSLAFAKLLGASVWPVLLACSQIPFLALWALWGGVTAPEMIATVGLSASIAVALISIGMASGAALPSAGLAFATSYGLAIAYLIILPIVFSHALPGPLAARIHPINALVALLTQAPSATKQWPAAVGSVVALMVVCGGVSAVCFLLRDAMRRAGTASARDRASRSVWDFSVLWRELRSSGGRRTTMFVRVSWVLSIIATVLAVVFLDDDFGHVCAVVAFIVIPPVLYAVLGATSVAGEKEAGTILPLLLAPQGSSRVVIGKIVGVVVRGAPVFGGPLIYAFIQRDDDMFLFWAICVAVALHLGTVGVLCSVLFRRVPIAVAGAFIGGVFQAAYAFVFFLFMGMLLALFLTLVLYGTMHEFDELFESWVLWSVVAGIGFVLVSAFNLYLATALFEPMARLDR